MYNQSWVGVRVETLRHLVSVVNLYIHLSAAFGDLSVGLAPLTQLKIFYAKQNNPTALTGDLFVLSDKVDLQIVDISTNTLLTGSLSDLGGLTDLIRFSCSNTLIDGDIAVLAGRALDLLRLDGSQVDTYTAATLSWVVLEANFRGLTGLSTHEISQMLVDVEAIGNSSGSLNYGECGTTYADLDASGQAAYNTLIARSWDITLDS